MHWAVTLPKTREKDMGDKKARPGERAGPWIREGGVR